MANNKSLVIADAIHVLSRITKHKLTGHNYFESCKKIRIYLQSISKDNHLTNDPPLDYTCWEWLRDDARLFLQIQNYINIEVIYLINHCDYVKELMDYLEFLYSGKGNISRIFEICKGFYRAEIYKELNVLLLFSLDIKIQQVQWEQMTVMSFLAGLNSQFDVAKSQILSSIELSSLHEVFTWIIHMDINSFAPPSTHNSNSLVSRTHEFNFEKLSHKHHN
ncbi:hypothetical protein K2173_027333 [Erythroxylum novogranatense]|uniref:Uncharacterized protein n=1 Tax=Erythroxylum novogranatense TaxID=1862640 RepID=A0AAV8U050_9ROSI|nr:hypothetical protein K2173_027333 [Erythroxylum novogranatense]